MYIHGLLPGPRPPAPSPMLDRDVVHLRGVCSGPRATADRLCADTGANLWQNPSVKLPVGLWGKRLLAAHWCSDMVVVVCTHETLLIPAEWRSAKQCDLREGSRPARSAKCGHITGHSQLNPCYPLESTYTTLAADCARARAGWETAPLEPTAAHSPRARSRRVPLACRAVFLVCFFSNICLTYPE